MVKAAAAEVVVVLDAVEAAAVVAAASSTVSGLMAVTGAAVEMVAREPPEETEARARLEAKAVLAVER